MAISPTSERSRLARQVAAQQAVAAAPSASSASSPSTHGSNRAYGCTVRASR